LSSVVIAAVQKMIPSAAREVGSGRQLREPGLNEVEIIREWLINP
jgi:hypothetical protein